MCFKVEASLQKKTLGWDSIQTLQIIISNIEFINYIHKNSNICVVTKFGKDFFLIVTYDSYLYFPMRSLIYDLNVIAVISSKSYNGVQRQNNPHVSQIARIPL